MNAGHAWAIGPTNPSNPMEFDMKPLNAFGRSACKRPATVLPPALQDPISYFFTF